MISFAVYAVICAVFYVCYMKERKSKWLIQR